MARLHCRIVHVVLLLLLTPVRPAAAVGVPYLVKDIRPGVASSNPQKLLSIGNKLFLGATDGATGVEPRVSDGTDAGTTLLRDVYVGPSNGFPLGCIDCNAISIGGTAYFTVFNGSGGSKLWKSDGSVAGTVEVYSAGTVSNLTDVGGLVFFAGQPTGFSSATLFRSDGSTPGTAMVSPNPLLTGYGMITVNGIAYFPASGGSGTELWRSDGSAPGTLLLRDLAGAGGSSYPTFLTKVGNRLFFYAAADLGPGICGSDGTTPGTGLLAQVTMASDRTTPNQIADLNGIAMFIASDPAHGPELWRSDGTVGGTYRVKDVNPGTAGGLAESELVAMGNAVYFAAVDGVNGKELWKSDGTEAGTVMLKDLYPQFGSFGSGSPAGLTNIRGTLFFRATSGGISGTQVWISDGTEAGTVQLAAVYPGGASQAASFTDVNGTVFFTADDGVHGIELWAVAAPTVGVEPIPSGALQGVTLAQSHPNPARSRTRIRYTLASAQHVRLRVFDMQGRAVRTLEEGIQTAGSHEAELDGGTLPSGIYLYRLETTSGSLQRKVLLTR